MYCMQAKRLRKPTTSLRLPETLLREIDALVERTRMRSRTEFIERAVEELVQELKGAKVVIVKPWTEAKARRAMLAFLRRKPGAYVTDLAESLGMDLELAFRVARRLAKEGAVERAS